ncbi:MAG: PIN domain-containing protein [Cyanobacteria bacterium J06555_13]
MTNYLLDTNIVLRLRNRSDRQHKLVTEAVSVLASRSDSCYLAAQVLIEFWVVATRPASVNGFGWSVEQTRSEINHLREVFPVVEESAQIVPAWLTLVTDHKVVGKRAHDARLAALMSVTHIGCVLTLNPKDFSDIPGITAVRPQEILNL